MDTCSNCGAILRPGAKFCTTCGTRLNTAASSNNDGWGTPRDTTPADVQETSVLEAVTPPEPEKPTTITGGDNQREYDRWTSAYASESATTDDPASRFISALQDQAKPTESETAEDESTETADPESTWVTPPPDAFKTPDPLTWNDQANTEEPSSDSAPPEETSESTTWRAPSTWNTVEESAEDDSGTIEGLNGIEADGVDSPQGGHPGKAVEVDLDTDDETDLDVEPDAAGFRVGGTSEVDYLSGDENIDVSGSVEPVLDPHDARDRAITLVDELRRMVRMMPGGGAQDLGAAAMALTEASLNINDFADVRDVLNELQDDPRDIQALSNLAKKADKIELLLDEHASLAAVIDSALQELNG